MLVCVIFLVQGCEKAVDVCACSPDRDGPGEPQKIWKLPKCVSQNVKEWNGGNAYAPQYREKLNHKS